MSRADGSVVVQSQPDVPGVYISAEQMLQSQYERALAAADNLDKFGSGQAGLPVPQVPGGGADVNTVPVPQLSPNYRVVTEGQRTRVDGNGNIIRY